MTRIWSLPTQTVSTLVAFCELYFGLSPNARAKTQLYLLCISLLLLLCWIHLFSQCSKHASKLTNTCTQAILLSRLFAIYKHDIYDLHICAFIWKHSSIASTCSHSCAFILKCSCVASKWAMLHLFERQSYADPMGPKSDYPLLFYSRKQYCKETMVVFCSL